MAKRFTTRYTENDELSHMVALVKQARKLAGYSQEEFGKLVGVSRETVLHIEGLVESTVLTLECELLKRWYATCAPRLQTPEKEALKTAISHYFFPT